MRNAIKVEDTDTGFQYEPNACMPYNYAELLDERLDEAYLTLYGLEEEQPLLLHEMKITYDGNAPDGFEHHMVVASDNVTELPAGSGRYKHELYLIERTKLLEGYIGQSLTFTNANTKPAYEWAIDNTQQTQTEG